MRSQVSNTAIITPVSTNSPQPPVRRRRAQSVQAVQGISRIHDSEPRRVSLFESNVSRVNWIWVPHHTLIWVILIIMLCLPTNSSESSIGSFSSEKKTLRFSYFIILLSCVLSVFHIFLVLSRTCSWCYFYLPLYFSSRMHSNNLSIPLFFATQILPK